MISHIIFQWNLLWYGWTIETIWLHNLEGFYSLNLCFQRNQDITLTDKLFIKMSVTIISPFFDMSFFFDVAFPEHQCFDYLFFFMIQCIRAIDKVKLHNLAHFLVNSKGCRIQVQNHKLVFCRRPSKYMRVRGADPTHNQISEYKFWFTKNLTVNSLLFSRSLTDYINNIFCILCLLNTMFFFYFPVM